MDQEDVLTPDEVAALVNACSRNSASGLRNRALIGALYRSGARVSELIAVERKHVDRDRRTIHLTHGRRRAIGMDSGAFFLIEKWLERSEEIGLADAVPLFPTLRGTPLSASYVRTLLPRLAAKAGIDKPVSSEMLRRTLAFELAREGHPLSLIQAQLGHRHPETTRRLLARIDSGDWVEVMRSRTNWRP